MGQSLVTTAYIDTNVTKAYSETASIPEKKEDFSPINSTHYSKVNHAHHDLSGEKPAECPLHKFIPKSEAVIKQQVQTPPPPQDIPPECPMHQSKPKTSSTTPADIPSECPMHQAKSSTASLAPAKRDESDINLSNMVSFLCII